MFFSILFIRVYLSIASFNVLAHTAQQILVALLEVF